MSQNPYELHTANASVDIKAAVRDRIKTAMQNVLFGAVRDYKRIMRDWIERYVPRKTGRLEASMMTTVDASNVNEDILFARFLLAAPAGKYADIVNKMGPRTNWGSSGTAMANPNAKTHYFDEAIIFANVLVKNMVMKYIRYYFAGTRISLTADQIYNAYFAGSRPVMS